MPQVLSISFFQGLVSCILFSVVGPWLVLVNKTLLTEKGFPFPILLSSIGLTSSAILAYTLVDILGVSQVSITSRKSVESYWKTAFPIGALLAASLAVGNITYLYVGVGLIQMLKSSTPAIIMGFSFLAGLVNPTKPVMLSVALITIGTAVTCVGSATVAQTASSVPNFNWFGIILFLVSSCCEAARLVATEYLLTDARLTVIEGQVLKNETPRHTTTNNNEEFNISLSPHHRTKCQHLFSVSLRVSIC
jgi:hypothetical protein